MVGEVKKLNFSEGTATTEPDDLFAQATGAGPVNLIDNDNGQKDLDQGQANDVQDWIDSGAGTTSTVTESASEIPLYPTITTGIKIAFAAGTNDYTRIRFTMPESLKNAKQGLKWTQLVSGYTSQTAKVELYTNADADYGGAYTEIPLKNDDGSGDTYISDANGQVDNSFDATDADYYELRFINDGATAGFVALNKVEVGPGLTNAGFGGWKQYTDSDTSGGVVDLTESSGTMTVNRGVFIPYQTNSGIWRLRFTITFTMTGVSLSNSFGVTMSGVTSKNTTNFIQALAVTDFNAQSRGTEEYISGYVSNNSGVCSMLAPKNIDWNNRWSLAGDIELESQPTWADDNSIVNTGINHVEYAYNDDVTSTTSVTASGFAYGQGGVNISSNWTSNTNYARRVRFQHPVQPGEVVVLEIERHGKWVEYGPGQASAIFPPTQHNTTRYGITVDSVSGSDTDFDVTFYGGGVKPGTTYGANGDTWDTVTVFKWRLKKYRSGEPIGFGNATSTERGLVFALKEYQIGTAYTNGTPTLSGSAGITHVASSLVPYPVGDNWRLKFNFLVSITTAVSCTATISGITSNATMGQTFDVMSASSADLNTSPREGVVDGRISTSSGSFFGNDGSASRTHWAYTGDISLDSKPTWAD